MCIYQVICLSVGGHLVCFLISAIVNSAAVNMSVQILLKSLISILREIPRSEIAGPYGSVTKTAMGFYCHSIGKLVGRQRFGEKGKG